MIYFKPEDFQCPCCGVDGVIEDAKERLMFFRAKVGIPMLINSSYRCEKHNASLKNAAKLSQHVQGTAFDVKWDHMNGEDKVKLLRPALELFTGIGLHKSFLHVDVRKGNRLVWFY